MARSETQSDARSETHSDTRTKPDRAVKVIQITAMPGIEGHAPYHLYALCDDGSIWGVAQPVASTVPEDWFPIVLPNINAPTAEPA